MVEVLTAPRAQVESSPEKKPLLDVILPTHNHLKLTMGCIEALYNHTQVPFHLIVVDDSTDLTPQYMERLQKEHDNITFIHSDEPYKCGNQLFNVGLAKAQTSYVATVMNSILVEPEWEIVAFQLMEKDPQIGIIGFKCLFPLELPMEPGLIESAGIMLNKFLPCDVGRDLPSHRLSKVYETDAVQWAFALVRKEAAMGNLGENTFHGFVGWDDIDNSLVLRSKGWKVVYCGLGVGYHYPRATRGNNSEEAFNLNRENAEAFYKRWGLWESFKKDNPTVPETLGLVEKIADAYTIIPKRG